MAGIYLHIPFCGRKCGYCDFYSIPERSGDIRSFCFLLAKEIGAAAGSVSGFSADTVFFGGGTPSLLDPSDVSFLLDSIRSGFALSGRSEVTLEANPGTLSPSKLEGYLKAGVNRMSIGVQSFVDSELRLIGRSHTAHDASEAVRQAREAGFDNIGVDILFGIPGQSISDLRCTLDRTLDLSPDHVSAYSLTVHEDTPFGERVRSGSVRMPFEEESADAFLLVSSVLAGAGYEHYEVSNYAKPGMRCRHNEGYWTHEPYLGFGPSAHSFCDGKRWWNVSDLDLYASRIRSGELPEAERETIDDEKKRIEAIGLGVRRSEGVDLALCRHRPDVLNGWVKEGLAVVADGRLKLTVKGFLLADEIAGELV
jgi:oxygen-independent coproporphyrinogen-3 oxidase